MVAWFFFDSSATAAVAIIQEASGGVVLEPKTNFTTVNKTVVLVLCYLGPKP